MALGDLFSDANEKQAFKAVKKGYRKGEAKAGAYLDTGRDTSLGYYQPYVDVTDKALSGYADALGLNGATGSDAATAAFRASPGYQYQLDQGSQDVLRHNAQAGDLGSGATSMDLAKYSQNLADQDWQSYLDRLSGLETQGANITKERAGIETDWANQRAINIMDTLRSIANAKSDYLKSKDQSGANILSAIFGGIKAVGGLAGLGG